MKQEAQISGDEELVEKILNWIGKQQNINVNVKFIYVAFYKQAKTEPTVYKDNRIN